jgi:hypothetical protein
MKIGIVNPTKDWNYIHEWTYRSMYTMRRPCHLVLPDEIRGGSIEEKREHLSGACIRDGCDYVAHFDADMIYHPNTLVDLLDLVENDGCDIGGIICYRGYGNYEPLLWSEDGERLLKPFIDFQFGDIVSVGQMGCACTLISRKVFEVLEQPWFRIAEESEERTIEGKPMRVYIRRGEDTYFTRRAKRVGFRLKVLTEYDTGHARYIPIDRELWAIKGAMGQLGDWEAIMRLAVGDFDWVIKFLEDLKHQRGVKDSKTAGGK